MCCAPTKISAPTKKSAMQSPSIASCRAGSSRCSRSSRRSIRRRRRKKRSSTRYWDGQTSALAGRRRCPSTRRSYCWAAMFWVLLGGSGRQTRLAGAATLAAGALAAAALAHPACVDTAYLRTTISYAAQFRHPSLHTARRVGWAWPGHDGKPSAT